MGNNDSIEPVDLFPRRIPSLDGLRAFAIVNVLIAHVELTPSYIAIMNRPAMRGLWFLFSTTCHPRVGVNLFFTLSGFLITWLLLTEKHRQGSISLRLFYIRRGLRILPVYWCFLLSAQLLHTLRPTVEGSPVAFLAALTFTTGWWPDNPYLLAHTWSLSVEEAFYLLWPVAICAFTAKRRWHFAWTVVAVAPLVRIAFVAAGQKRLFDFAIISNGDAIMWGCLAAMVLWNWPARVMRFAQRRAGAGRLLALALILFCNASSWTLHHPILIELQKIPNQLMVPFQVTFHSLASAYLIWSLTLNRRGLLFQIVNHPLVMALGILSYSLYLWQEPFLNYSSTYTPAWWQCFPQNLGLVFAVAAVSYFAIERPILQQKKHLAPIKLQARPA